MQDAFLNGGYIGQKGAYSDGGIWLIDKVSPASFVAKAAYSTLSASSGTISITDTNLNGSIPTGCMFLGGLTSGGSADSSLGVGLTDGTNQCSFSMSANHGVTTTAAARIRSESYCMYAHYNRTTGLYKLSAPSFIADGISVTKDTTASVFLGHLFITGVPCAVGTINSPSGSLGGATTVSGLSFQPTAVIFINNWSPSANTFYGVSLLDIGFVDENLNQGAIGWATQDAVGTSDVRTRVGGSYVIHDAYQTSGYAFECTSLNSDGFTLTTRATSAATSQRIGYLAIGNCRSHVVVTNTDSANKSIGSSDFTPTASVHSWSLVGYDSRNVGTAAEYCNIGFASQGTDVDSWYTRVRSRDAVGTTNENNSYGASGFIGNFGHLSRTLDMVSYNSSGGGVVNSSSPQADRLVSLFLGPK